MLVFSSKHYSKIKFIFNKSLEMTPILALRKFSLYSSEWCYVIWPCRPEALGTIVLTHLLLERTLGLAT